MRALHLWRKSQLQSSAILPALHGRRSLVSVAAGRPAPGNAKDRPAKQYSGNSRGPPTRSGNPGRRQQNDGSAQAAAPSGGRATAASRQPALAPAPAPKQAAAAGRPPPAAQEEQPDSGAGVPQATFVPRDPSITDGVWSRRDMQLVMQSQQDADEAVSRARIDAEGYVLLGKSLDELKELAEEMGQPKYRGQQLYDGMLKGARSVDDIPTIPKTFREHLKAAGVRTGRSAVHHRVSGPDGTTKLLLQLSDGRVVETVGIPTPERLTVCVSSQVGCPMRCSFCATGKGGFARNLSPHEIVDQVMAVQEQLGRRVSNVVFMGMGEPLLNLKSVVAAYEFLNKGLGIGGRSITISTVGVPNAITKLAQHKLAATLAVSIHAPNQAVREQIIPSAKAYPLPALLKECETYFRLTKRRVTFEYTLLGQGVNDAPEHARELAELLQHHKLATHVNLIPWNPVDESEYKRPSSKRVDAFKQVLEAAGLMVSVRTTRGLEAAAACGQLRNQFQKQALPAAQQRALT